MNEATKLAERQHGAVAVWQLKRIGYSKAAVRQLVTSGRFESVCRGVLRVCGAKRTHLQSVMAAVLAAGPDAVASHRTAAWLHGLPGFRPRGIEVTRRRGHSHRGPLGYVHESRRILPGHTTTVDGIPVTTVARTIFDLAAVLRAGRVSRALDNALTRDLVAFSAVATVLQELGKRGRTGTRLIRELLDARGAGYIAPASELEAILIEVLTRAGLPTPEREMNVGDHEGWIGRVEFVYRKAGVLIECDSRKHHTALLDWEADRLRDNRLMAAGWRVLRITWEQLTQRPYEVVRLVRTALGLAA